MVCLLIIVLSKKWCSVKKAAHSTCSSMSHTRAFPKRTVVLQCAAEVLYAYIPFYHKLNKIIKLVLYFASSRPYEDFLFSPSPDTHTHTHTHTHYKFEIVKNIMTCWWHLIQAKTSGMLPFIAFVIPLQMSAG